MGRKKNDFRPDTVRQDLLGKILLTKKQRRSLLRWVLYTVVCVSALIFQDVLLSRLDILGATTDLVPCCILAVCILQGAESGSLFVLIAALVFYFSGSSPGLPCIPLITGLAVFAAIFRQAYLRQGFFTLLLCLAVTMLAYELITFGLALFMGYTDLVYFGAVCLKVPLTLLAVPILYPVLTSIGKIGGETWKE